MADDFDQILVGGGLQNGLIALATLHRHPRSRIAVIESAGRLGGNHTWCFHSDDVPSDVTPWLQSLLVCSWPRYQVFFPGLHRTVDQPYRAISSERLGEVLGQRLRLAPGCAALTGRQAVALEARAVTLENGQRLSAKLVVDGRGPLPVEAGALAGYQRFVGLEVRLTREAPFEVPILMDARAPQGEGFHFTYLLPFEPRRLLVEDTVFAEQPGLDTEAARCRALEYLDRAGLRVRQVLREESGVLTMPWRSLPAPAPGALAGGVRGGWFHPGTGYSLAPAMRLARYVASRAPADPRGRGLNQLRRQHLRQARFARLLNWLIFRAVEPAQRWRVMRRFYQLPQPLIGRYYALSLSPLDQARILLAGWPLRGLRWPPRVVTW